MLTEITAALLSQWRDLEPEFQNTKASLMAAKDRDDMYTLLVAENKLDEAIDQAEEYGYAMTEAKRCFESVRMIIETISSEDADHPTVKDIMATWDPYLQEADQELLHGSHLQEKESQRNLVGRPSPGRRGQYQDPIYGGRGQQERENNPRGDETQIQPCHQEIGGSPSHECQQGLQWNRYQQPPSSPSKTLPSSKLTKLPLRRALIHRDAGLERGSIKLVRDCQAH